MKKIIFSLLILFLTVSEHSCIFFWGGNQGHRNSSGANSKNALTKALYKLRGVSTVRIYGGSNPRYYWMNMRVGTPGQMQSLLIHTQSQHITFPCTMAKVGEGIFKHANPPFDYHKSTTSQGLRCKDKFMNWHCGNKSCPPEAGCSFSHSLDPSSTQKGWVFVDRLGIEVDPKIQMGNNIFKGKKWIKVRKDRNQKLEKYYRGSKFPHEQTQVKAGRRRMLAQKVEKSRRLAKGRNLKFLIAARSTFPVFAGAFGCVSKETGVFKNLQTSGVLGLGPKSNEVTKPPTLVEMMHKNKYIIGNNFSICFANEGGYMALGGYNTTKHIMGEKPSVIKYSDNYKIKVNQIILHEEYLNKKGKLKYKNKNILKDNFEAILDTGNSESSFPPKAFEAIKRQYDTYCDIEKSRCGGVPKLTPENYCVNYSQKTYGSLATFFSKFPRLFFKLDGKTYVWFAYDYMYKDVSKSAQDGSSAVYCSGISLKPEDPKNDKSKIAVLGVNFMKHYDWYFMKKTSKISFTRSECDERRYSETGVPIEGMKKYVKSTMDAFDKIST